MATPEGKVKEPIRKFLKQLPGVWAYWPVQMGMGAHGIPDCVGIASGHPFAVEVKAKGKLDTLTAAQEYQIDSYRKCGGTVFVTDDAADFMNKFIAWSKGFT